jgi:hypothetical protein
MKNATHPFVQQVAGLDLSLALAYTCPPVLVIAGLIGILGARWMKADMLAVQRMGVKNSPSALTLPIPFTGWDSSFSQPRFCGRSFPRRGVVVCPEAF